MMIHRRRAQLSRLLSFPYFDHYLELADVEGRWLGFGGSERVLFIGGGPLPLTPIALAVWRLAAEQGLADTLRTLLRQPGSASTDLVEFMDVLEPRGFRGGFRVISIDCQPEAVHKARRAVRTLELHQLIQIEHGDGALCCVPGQVQAVFVASMAEPKPAILKNVLRQCEGRSAVNVLVRSVPGGSLRQLLYDPLPPDLLDELQLSFPGLRRRGAFEPEPESRLINSFELLEIGVEECAAQRADTRAAA